MYNISFIGPNYPVGPVEINAYYLPYSCGILWSYVNQFEEINKNISLNEIIWKREDISEAALRLAKNDIICASTYLWNNMYNNTLLRKIKEINPSILIIVGGPQYPIQNKNFFFDMPYIDVCVKQEGEITLKNILIEFLNNKKYSTIPGILYNNKGNLVDTGDSQRIMDLDEIPSPYLTGVFDSFYEDYPDVKWNTILETNRGCPYQCTFCDWGSLTYAKIKKFDISRVYDEIEWMANHNTEFISFTDANFGIFPERDSLIADKIIEVQHKYNFPKAYTLAWAKNQKKEIIDIADKLIHKGKSRIGLNLSVQSLDEHTLKTVKRSNLAINKIEDIFKECEQRDIPLYTELIVGLPGETLETWKNNFYLLYKYGNHNGITAYFAQMLVNSEMNLSQAEEHGIKTCTVNDYLFNYETDREVPEQIEIVVATNDMPFDDMIEATVITWFHTTFHIDGLSNYISRALYQISGIEYNDFYEKLFIYLDNDEWALSEKNRIRDFLKSWFKDGKAETWIGNTAVNGFNLIHSTIIRMHHDSKADYIIDLIEQFVNDTYGNDLDHTLLSDIIELQRSFVVRYDMLNQYPYARTFEHDILGNLVNGTDLYVPCTYTIDFPEDKDVSLSAFCQNLMFARRRNYGKTLITKCNDC